METLSKTKITVETIVNASASKVWEFWNSPEHITNWCSASEEWHAPFAENDLKLDGRFKTTMAAKDGSFSFDFEGVYTSLQQNKLIEYTLLDGRNVSITFSGDDKETKVVEIFEAEDSNPIDMQKEGWQAILDNFKKYTESN